MLKKVFEMPYILYHGKKFDLEFEQYKNAEDFISHLYDIFSGNNVSDKYGNNIVLKNRRDKIDFLNSIVNDEIFKNFFKYKFNDSEKKIFNIMVDMIKG